MKHVTAKQSLRKQICLQRAAIPIEKQKLAAKKLLTIVTNLVIFKQAQRIALYWPHNAEIDPLLILNQAIAMHKTCYLPVLYPGKQKNLLFLPYRDKDPLQLNKYGILEPKHNYQQAISLDELAIIFIPLVAFDMHGHRLGMGGGYYDTTLAAIQKFTKQPLCIGLGYAMQEVPLLPHDNWDFTLDGVITENEYKIFHNSKLHLL